MATAAPLPQAQVFSARGTQSMNASSQSHSQSHIQSQSQSSNMSFPSLSQVFDAGSIRVLAVPVGRISRERFEFYVGSLRSCDAHSLNELDPLKHNSFVLTTNQPPIVRLRFDALPEGFVGPLDYPSTGAKKRVALYGSGGLSGFGMGMEAEAGSEILSSSGSYVDALGGTDSSTVANGSSTTGSGSKHVTEPLLETQQQRSSRSSSLSDVRKLPPSRIADDSWGSLMQSRRILAIVGIALAHDYPDLTEAERDFTWITSHYPTRVAKCFCFEPVLNQADLEREHSSIVMFPHVGDDMDQLKMYVYMQLQDIVRSLLGIIEGWLGNDPTQREEPAYLRTPLDPLTLLPAQVSKLKSRKKSRMIKYRGDWLLLASGSTVGPQLAIAQYTEALEQCRSNNDWIWCGAACEGMLSAHAVAASGNLHGLYIDHLASTHTPALSSSTDVDKVSGDGAARDSDNDTDDDNDDDDDRGSGPIRARRRMTAVPRVMEELFNDALAYYQRPSSSADRGDHLAVDLCLKMARVWAEVAAHALRKSGKAAGHSKAKTCSVLQEAERISRNLGPADRASVFASSAVIYKLLDYHRKAAFALREGARLQLQAGLPHSSHRLLKMAVPAFGLQEIDNPWCTCQSGARSIFSAAAFGGASKDVAGAVGDDSSINGNGRMGGPIAAVIREQSDERKGIVVFDERSRFRGWAWLQIEVLRGLRQAAVAIGDHRAVVRYASAILRIVGTQTFIGLKKRQMIDLEVSCIEDVFRSARKMPCPVGIASVSDVDLCGALSVVQIEPHVVLPQNMPKSTSAPSTSRSLFLYSPFQRAAAPERDTADTSPWHPDNKNIPVWVSGDVVHFSVVLRNDLHIPLDLTNITICARGTRLSRTSRRTGERREVMTTFVPFGSGTCVLQPRESRLVVLSGKALLTCSTTVSGGTFIQTPSSAERIVIEGILVTAYNVVAFLPVNRLGAGVSLARFAALRVEDDLANPRRTRDQLPTTMTPDMNRRLTICKTNAKICMTLPQLHVTTSWNGMSVQVLEGEEAEHSIQLCNVGNIPVDYVTLQVEHWDDRSPRPLIDLDPESDAVSVDTSSLELDSKYCALPLQPGTTCTIPILIRGLWKTRGGQLTIRFGSWMEPTKRVPLTHEREHVLRLHLDVQRGLHITAIDVLPQSGGGTGSGRSDTSHCLLSLEVKNPSVRTLDCKFYVAGTQLSKFTETPSTCRDLEYHVFLEPRSTQQVLMPLPRFILPFDAIPEPRMPRGQFIRGVHSVKGVTAEELNELRYRYWYQHVLSTCVRVLWICNARDASGIAPLFSRGIVLTPAGLDALRASDVRFELKLQDVSDPLSCVTGQPFNLLFSITNLETDSRVFTIWVQCADLFADAGAGLGENSAGVLFAGNPVLTEVTIAGRGTYEHQVGLVVVNEGEYGLQVVVARSACREPRKLSIKESARQQLPAETGGEQTHQHQPNNQQPKIHRCSEMLRIRAGCLPAGTIE